MENTTRRRKFEDARPLLTGTIRRNCGLKIGKNLEKLRREQREQGKR